MPQYLAPGVYVEEVPSAIKPIAGVGTSTAGFVGAVADNVGMPLIPGRTGKKADGSSEPADYYSPGPAGTPQLILSWEEFKNSFGDIQAGNRTLAHAVYGFFNNGGTRCYVSRVSSGTAAPKDEDDALDGDLIHALDAFQAIDEIALVAIPGAARDSVQSALLDHCEDEFLQDRFAILDGRRATTLDKAAIQGGTRDSSYAAIYYPWIEVYDPVSGARLVVPPSGHIAGVYSRVDSDRGVHKAPANEVIRGALGVETLVSKAGQAGLNPDGVNVIRKFNGNITIWGARTLGGDHNAEWKYVNVRRLFNFLRESIDQGTQWVVFEPNGPELWSKIGRNVSAFLNTVWASGALLGATPEQAFYVRCDETNNPREVRDQGQVIIEVGVAVVTPAEFVVFRISQWAGPGQ
jgi:phage tail sheath protein FI